MSRVLDRKPAGTLLAMTSVGTWLFWVPSSSSQVIASSEFWVVNAGELRIVGTFWLSQVSPVEIEQSCMSSQRFGVTHA